MTTLTINDSHFNLPTTWNELTGEQILRVAELASLKITPSNFKLMVLLAVTGLKVVEDDPVNIDGMPHYYLKCYNKNVHLVSVQDIEACTRRLDFMFEKEVKGLNEKWVLNSWVTKNIIGEVKHDGHLLYGPSDNLTNITTEEYIRCEVSFYKYHEKHRPEYLNDLFAALWRPAGGNNSTDIREAYDDGIVISRAKTLSKVPFKYKMAVLLFYTGCRKSLMSKFKNSSSGGGGTEKDIFMQFMRLVNGLANNDVTKHEQVRKSLLMDTLITIDEIASQQKESERKNRKRR